MPFRESSSNYDSGKCEKEEESEDGDLAYTSSGSAGDSCLLDNHDDDEVTILCELVGARNLAIADEQEVGDLDTDSLRPFCTVRYGGNIIHKTKVAEDLGPNPIWTASTKSLFLLKTTPREMSENSITIGLYSKPERSLSSRLGLGSSNIFLGLVSLDCDDVLSHCDQKRFEVNVEDELGEESSSLGSLALRFRLATEADQQIVRQFNQDSRLSKEKSQRAFENLVLNSSRGNVFVQCTSRPKAKLVTETDEGQIAQTNFVNALSTVFSARTVRDRATGGHKIRIKPYPDPEREKETKFMSQQEIRVETRRPSHNWVEAGSGTLGKLFCEVLACHDLPNVDFGEAVGNVTDSFVCLVHEDACAMTEVIDDELSPHWLPWTQRAFSFGFMHPASILYIGVFDYDLGTSHEPIGRIAVNVSNLQRNTIHTLKYNLYPSSNVTDRTAVGSITIRVRIDCHDEKAALLVALKPRPKIFVNVKKPKSFKVVRYTCFGEFDGEETFDVTVARSYMNEFFEYKAAFSYAISDAATSLVFWRGQVEIFSLMVPLHSFLFFCMATDLVERPYMVISYSLLCVAWIMLANLTIRRQHPSPWNTCPPFWHFLHILSTGKSPTPVSAIKEYEGEAAAQAYEKAWKGRLEQDRLIAEEQWKLQEKLNKIGDDNISTKLSPSAIPLDILARLARWQGMAGQYCRHLRFIKIILTWEESVVSFWITAVFLAAGFVTMLLPWRFILTWSGRVLVWGFLGPHMKLVDLYFRANRKEDGKLLDLVEKFHVQSSILRLRREEALKTKDIKALVFGEYSTQVPSFNIARHFDRPLPESSARPCRALPKRGANRRVSVVDLNKTSWIPGQQLFGVMVPRPRWEATLQEEEFVHQGKKLERLKTLIGNHVASAGVKALKKINARHMLGLDSRVPLSFGYEVIAEFDDRESSTNAEKKRISVVPPINDNGMLYVGIENHLLLESYGGSVYEVKPPDAYEDEEGLEVVGLGRFSTLSQDVEEEKEGDPLLSLLYPSSEKTIVTYFRPLDEPVTIDTDDDLD